MEENKDYLIDLIANVAVILLRGTLIYFLYPAVTSTFFPKLLIQGTIAPAVTWLQAVGLVIFVRVLVIPNHKS